VKLPWALTVPPGRLLTGLWRLAGGQTFIVMHTGRVGSVVIGEMLRAHPGVRFDHDPLHRRRLAWEARHGAGVPFGEDPRAEIMRRPWRAGRRVYGVVIKPAQFEVGPVGWAAMLAYLDRTLQPKRIAMTRRNLLRQVISGCRALELDQFHVYGGAASGQALQAPPDRLPRFFGPPYTVLEALAERERYTAQAAAAAQAAGERGLQLVYEEHIEADPYVGYSAVCRFLGVPPQPAARPTLTRTGNRPVRALVADPARWDAALRGSRWEWMLDT
jgi:hypothetical protein